MAQHQLLIIVMGIFIIGAAIVAGVAVFTTHSIASNKDGIMEDLVSLAKFAYGYRLRPLPYGGGGHTYMGFIIPPRLAVNANAAYATEVNPAAVLFTATSKLGYGSITAEVDSNGVISNLVFTGDF